MTSDRVEDTMEEGAKDIVDSENKDNMIFRKVIFEPIRIGPVSTLDEMDGKVLQFQNKKLQMKLDEYQRIEDELQQRIEQLEKRQNQDETVMNVVNSHWERLNTNVTHIFTRYDDVFYSNIRTIENEKISSFLRTLNSCNEETRDVSKFVDMIHVSIEALTKILKNYDYVLTKNEKTLAVMKAASKNCKRIDQFDDILPFDDEDLFIQNNHNLPRVADDVTQNCKTFEDGNLYEKLTACIEGLDRVSELETSDGTEKSNKPSLLEASSSVSENGIRSETTPPKPASSFVEDDKIVTEVLDEIVDMIIRIDEKNDTNRVDGDPNIDKIDGRDASSSLVEKCKSDGVSIANDSSRKEDNSWVPPEQELRTILDQFGADNTKLQNLIKTFQLHYEESTAKERAIMRALETKEEEYKEWKSRIEDIEYENEKLKSKKIKIERHLAETPKVSQRMKSREISSPPKTDVTSMNEKKLEELEEELEIQRKLTHDRCQELKTLRIKYQNAVDSLKELENKTSNIPDDVVENTTEYKCLQSQFSVLYNETIQIKDQIEEYHAQVQTLNVSFTNKLEMTETEDLMTLRKLQADLQEMQSLNSSLKREYQTLKTEFEKNLIANEQTGPLNREMRYLLVRLQKHNKHLKHEAQRYKHRYKQLNSELNALSKQCYADSKFKLEPEGGSSSDFDEVEYGLESTEDLFDPSTKEEHIVVKKEESSNNDESDVSRDAPISPHERPSLPITVKQEASEYSPPSSPSLRPSMTRSQLRFPNPGSSRLCSTARWKLHEYHEMLARGSKEVRECIDTDDMDYDKLSDDEYVQDLRSQLKKAEVEQKELKLLLDMYRGVNRDKRENMELICVEKKLKTDIEETKVQMRRILEIKRENRKKMADENALRKIKHLEDQNYGLMRQINVHKQEEEALLSEMEVTNQAFEDMQEQNSRLIQQLREKDDANSKLMAERIKSNLLYKLTREENENLQLLIDATAKQLDSVTTVMNELEVKEQVYQMAINNVEKEINLRQQALDSHRKKAMENAQSSTEAKLTLEKLMSEMRESKECIVEKLITLDEEAFKYNRLQEEVKILRRRVERLKKLEPSEQPDIVLVEEVREYKEMLTCQSCKVRRKDAVLSKCFHVFCWECLRTRYETRQRKCPKCNATFGANDYHRLFFTNC